MFTTCSDLCIMEMSVSFPHFCPRSSVVLSLGTPEVPSPAASPTICQPVTTQASINQPHYFITDDFCVPYRARAAVAPLRHGARSESERGGGGECWAWEIRGLRLHRDDVREESVKVKGPVDPLQQSLQTAAEWSLQQLISEVLQATAGE
ncbi:hypothetical protein WMY93_013381 [Mugilogobius chulae]|uniref:Uncharacterized protein n=1 Tax=Mugilogobius chulae TaxID=88201 RepID=A0AAW0P8Z0_9GOBI